jgi:hypothetical protein
MKNAVALLRFHAQPAALITESRIHKEHPFPGIPAYKPVGKNRLSVVGCRLSVVSC